MHPTLQRVTDRIRRRSEAPRAAYLERIERARGSGSGSGRSSLSCSNLAHGIAACSPGEKQALHKLMPFLGVLQSSGLKVALLTDGRLSGASGKVLAAIHVAPETLRGGFIGKVRDGDRIRIDAQAGLLEVDLPAEELDARPLAGPGSQDSTNGMGRELFEVFRANAGDSEAGASVFPG